MTVERDIPDDIAKHLRTWEFSALAWQLLLVILAVGGIVCALAVTGFVDTLEPRWTRLLAFASAVSFSVISGLNLSRLAANFRTAWRHLNSACMRYRRSEEFTDEQLIVAYEQGELIIGQLELHAKAQGAVEHAPKKS
ncbi:MAG: hypothetical protein HQ523_03105 [Lentisphaerae bacterium]|nr:hypothetical protein [Lentisphaerota bacterium]